MVLFNYLLILNQGSYAATEKNKTRFNSLNTFTTFSLTWFVRRGSRRSSAFHSARSSVHVPAGKTPPPHVCCAHPPTHLLGCDVDFGVPVLPKCYLEERFFWIAVLYCTYCRSGAPRCSLLLFIQADRGRFVMLNLYVNLVCLLLDLVVSSITSALGYI